MVSALVGGYNRAPQRTGGRFWLPDGCNQRGLDFFYERCGGRIELKEDGLIEVESEQRVGAYLVRAYQVVVWAFGYTVQIKIVCDTDEPFFSHTYLFWKLESAHQ